MIDREEELKRLWIQVAGRGARLGQLRDRRMVQATIVLCIVVILILPNASVQMKVGFGLICGLALFIASSLSRSHAYQKVSDCAQTLLPAARRDEVPDLLTIYFCTDGPMKQQARDKLLLFLPALREKDERHIGKFGRDRLHEALKINDLPLVQAVVDALGFVGDGSSILPLTKFGFGADPSTGIAGNARTSINKIRARIDKAKSNDSLLRAAKRSELPEALLRPIGQSTDDPETLVRNAQKPE